MRGPSAGMRMAEGDAAPEFTDNIVQIDDSNIPLSEMRVDTTYKVIYRPKKDLVEILEEIREASEATQKSFNLLN